MGLRPIMRAGIAWVLAVAALGGPVILGAGAPSSATTGTSAASAGGLASSISLVGSAVDGEAFTGARLWDEPVNWCDLQPRADSDITANLEALLAPRLDRLIADGATRVMLPLGHAAPWVFGNHARAVAQATRWSKGVRPIWFCSGRASAISIPAPAALTRNPDGSLSVQQARFQHYVSTVVDFLAERYAGRLAVDLQVMNEPNLYNGLDPKLRIPGAASTTAQCVAALVGYEALALEVLAARPGLPFRLVSPSLYQRTNDFMRRYLSAQNRIRSVSALAFNVYSRRQTPDSMITDWDAKARRLTALVYRYRNLRGLPMLVTETNHNLNNHKPKDRSNSRGSVTAASVQTRLAAATQLNAVYLGFAEVFWLLPMTNQAAVRVTLLPSNPARNALAALARAVGAREPIGCQSQRGVRQCNFSDPTGVQQNAAVIWRLTRTTTVQLGADMTVVTLTGSTTTYPGGSIIRVGTTPLVLIPVGT